MKYFFVLLLATLCLSSSFFPERELPYKSTSLFNPVVHKDVLDVWNVKDTPLVEYSLPSDFDEIITKYSLQFNVPEVIIRNVIYCESGGNPRAVNRNATSIDRGLMQINDRSFELDFKYRYNGGVDIDYFDSDDSVRIGTKHLSVLYSLLNDWQLTVAAYNCGLSRLRTGSVPAITKRHVRRVFGHGLKGELH